MEWKGCFFWGRMLGTGGIRESNIVTEWIGDGHILAAPRHILDARLGKLIILLI